MNNDIVEKGNKIVQEFGEAHQDTLKKWMAHYIAELMVKASSENVDVAKDASAKCSCLINKLWNSMIRDELKQLHWAFERRLEKISDDIDKNEEFLRNILSEPENFEVESASDAVDVLYCLCSVERYLLLLSRIIHRRLRIVA